MCIYHAIQRPIFLKHAKKFLFWFFLMLIFLQTNKGLVYAQDHSGILGILNNNALNVALNDSNQLHSSWDVLSSHWETPEWIKDAKFGLWIHWGPQSVPRLGGGWYARHMYMQDVGDQQWGRNAYDYHCEHYGHPSTYGYKDLIHHEFKARKFDAYELVKQFKSWGARYVVMLANHHDNYDLFPSTVHKWNSVRVGPHRNLIGEFVSAARNLGLPYGFTTHAYRAKSWFEPAYGADEQGSKKGVPYDGRLTIADGKGKWWDGLNPQQLYAHEYAKFHEEYGKRLLELVTHYQPKMLYFDTYSIPSPAKKACIRLYANSLEKHGSIQSIVTVKSPKTGTMLEVERGGSDTIKSSPFQTGTSMYTGWFRKEDENKNLWFDTRCLVEMLVDNVSKNGVLMLNVALYGNGSLPKDQKHVLDGLAAWLDINGEAIYKTRPWKYYGVGGEVKDGHFTQRTRFSSEPWDSDVLRFTRSKDNKTLYVFVFGEPAGEDIIIQPPPGEQKLFQGQIQNLSILGIRDSIVAELDTQGLHVNMPGELYPSTCHVIKIQTTGL